MKRKKERDRESEKKPQPDKLEVICPLIFKLTHLAVNYDLTWQPETRLIVEDNNGSVVVDTTGSWKSNPVMRGHTQAFQRELQKMKESQEVGWNESAYYFTHEEGVEARKAYENLVLEGTLRAHIASWGPNPKKAHDKSRFHKFTGVTFEDLKEKYSDLYSPHSKSKSDRPKSESTEAVTVSKKEMETVVEENSQKEEPSASDLKEIQEEQRVAAATRTDETIEDLMIEAPLDEDEDDHETLVLYVSASEISERISTDHEAVAWKDDSGNERKAYLQLLPEIDREMWLEEGKYTIDGVKYEVRVEE